VACLGAADLLWLPRFPREVIRQAMWLHLRFTLSYHSYQDVEDLLNERGFEGSYVGRSATECR
jgi:transposase-like protein